MYKINVVDKNNLKEVLRLNINKEDLQNAIDTYESMNVLVIVSDIKKKTLLYMTDYFKYKNLIFA